jgi:hypothetical protein
MIAAALTTIPIYREAAKSEFTLETTAGWIVAILAGGMVLGAVLTWGEKKFGKKP